MEKVLCATDHSEAALKAEAFAANWAKAFGAKLIYAYVSHITEDDMGTKGSRSSTTAILKEVALQEHEVLSHARQVAEKAGISGAECVLLRSHKIALSLVNHAKKEGVDHIIVGSSGNSKGLSLLVLGSIASQIVGGAACPVTVVH